MGGKSGLPPSHKSSRSQTPQPGHRIRPGGSKTSLQAAGISPGSIVPLPPPPQTSEQRTEPDAASKKFNLFQVSFKFIPPRSRLFTVFLFFSPILPDRYSCRRSFSLRYLSSRRRSSSSNPIRISWAISEGCRKWWRSERNTTNRPKIFSQKGFLSFCPSKHFLGAFKILDGPWFIYFNFFTIGDGSST